MIVDYKVSDNYIELHYTNEKVFLVKITDKTGRIIKRPVVNNGVQNTKYQKGIILGDFLDGTTMVLYNQLIHGKVIAYPLSEFKNCKNYYFDDVKHPFSISQIEIILTDLINNTVSELIKTI